MINDALPSTELFTLTYVDDLTLVQCRQSHHPSNMQLAANNLLKWSRCDNMRLNSAKCIKMDVSFMREPPNESIVWIGDHQIHKVCTMKVFGVYIQNDLK